jgi:hypothetical protein
MVRIANSFYFSSTALIVLTTEEKRPPLPMEAAGSVMGSP